MLAGFGGADRERRLHVRRHRERYRVHRVEEGADVGERHRVVLGGQRPGGAGVPPPDGGQRDPWGGRQGGCVRDPGPVAGTHEAEAHQTSATSYSRVDVPVVANLATSAAHSAPIGERSAARADAMSAQSSSAIR